jgi:guanosine-3',5'-bis(diphosphate) 3'-pyrophosphohydrolase
MVEDIGLIFKALEFAAARHKNQFRKGEDRAPYINHPIQVASLLANEACERDTVLLTAAILHDVIEDTVITDSEKENLIEQISLIFGKEILELTLEVTDDKNLEKKERKRLQIEEAGQKSIRARKLRIADKILNVRDITFHPPVDWTVERILEYFDWAEKVIDGVRGVNKYLEDMFDRDLAFGRQKYRKD